MGFLVSNKRRNKMEYFFTVGFKNGTMHHFIYTLKHRKPQHLASQIIREGFYIEDMKMVFSPNEITSVWWNDVNDNNRKFHGKITTLPEKDE
jgi:hypothetical protein